MKYFLATIIPCLLLIAACKKDENDPIIFGYEYFPIEEGHYVTYSVTDIFHDEALAVQHDTDRYQIKEVVGESFEDGEGETSQKLRRYFRTSDTLEWELQDVWSLKVTPTTAEVVEENDRVIRMIFAIAYDRTWDYNALNNEDEQISYYEDIYENYTFSDQSFDSTVIVEREDFTSFIDYRRSYDVYARDIGRIIGVHKDLMIDNFDTLDIKKGSELFYEMIDFGTE